MNYIVPGRICLIWLYPGQPVWAAKFIRMATPYGVGLFRTYDNVEFVAHILKTGKADRRITIWWYKNHIWWETKHCFSRKIRRTFDFTKFPKEEL